MDIVKLTPFQNLGNYVKVQFLLVRFVSLIAASALVEQMC